MQTTVIDKNWKDLIKPSKLEIKSNNPIEIDGDYFANGPAQIFIENLAIRFKI